MRALRMLRLAVPVPGAVRPKGSGTGKPGPHRTHFPVSSRLQGTRAAQPRPAGRLPHTRIRVRVVQVDPGAPFHAAHSLPAPRQRRPPEAPPLENRPKDSTTQVMAAAMINTDVLDLLCIFTALSKKETVYIDLTLTLISLIIPSVKLAKFHKKSGGKHTCLLLSAAFYGG